VLLQATETFWLWQFLGRLHPLLVHFPIGLLLVALLFELIDWKRKSTGLRDATKILTWVGAGSAVFAVTFGLLLASAEDASGTSLEIHRWAGIATMTLASSRRFLCVPITVSIYRGLLLVTVFGVSLAGHYGAMLTHGDDYLTSVLPSSVRTTTSRRYRRTGFRTHQHRRIEPATSTGPECRSQDDSCAQLLQLP
jgi:uncharacterized membrane protein